MRNIPFEISAPLWNNAFSYPQRKSFWSDCKITIPARNHWKISDIELWTQIVFEEISPKWTLESFTWLKHLIYWNRNKIPFCTVDNHNFVLAFRRKLFQQWTLTWKEILIHIDQHSDLNKPEKMIKFPKSESDFTEYLLHDLNVWNFIIPAQNRWFFKKIIRIKNETDLQNLSKNLPKENYVLDLDLDFFHPLMGTQNTKNFQIIKKLSQEARAIFLATSPYFIDQKIAVQCIKKIFIQKN
jgi:hypothetical protein